MFIVTWNKLITEVFTSCYFNDCFWYTHLLPFIKMIRFYFPLFKNNLSFLFPHQIACGGKEVPPLHSLFLPHKYTHTLTLSFSLSLSLSLSLLFFHSSFFFLQSTVYSFTKSFIHLFRSLLAELTPPLPHTLPPPLYFRSTLAICRACFVRSSFMKLSVVDFHSCATKKKTWRVWKWRLLPRCSSCCCCCCYCSCCCFKPWTRTQTFLPW